MRGLTQGDVAERAGLDTGHVSRIERAVRPNVTLASLVALAHALDVELRDLF